MRSLKQLSEESIVNESIFDDNIEEKFDNAIQIEKIYKKFLVGRKYGLMCRNANDMMGNPINKGDIVILSINNKLYCDCVRGIEEDTKGWKWMILDRMDLKAAPIQSFRVKNEDVKTFLKIISK